MDKEHFQKLLSFIQQKGFVWGPEPEIYGGLSGFYTYGPLGKLLKNIVEEEIRFTFTNNEFMEVECPTIMPAKVWEASGHLGGFTDPLVKDEKGNLHRADVLIEEFYAEKGITEATPKTKEDIIEAIKKHEITADGLKLVPEIKDHTLMMKTTVGIDTEAYSRPETATTTYLPFTRYDNFFRGKYPFSVFQIGKAYRNEISPRQHLLRVREFTQAEAQMFILPDQKNTFEKFNEVKEKVLPLWTWELQESREEPEEVKVSEAVGEYLETQAYAWTLTLAYDLFLRLGIPKENIRLRQHGLTEKAFYAADAWDVEIKTRSFGWVEVCGVHDRTDYDLNKHAEFSKKLLETTLDDGTKIRPHILEIAFGTDRPTFALLDTFYDYKQEKEGKTTFRIPYKMAPVKIAVFPLMNKPELTTKAKEIYNEIKKFYQTKFDVTASIGKRYLRASEEGIPWCVTVDFDTLQDGTVTVRDRDSEKQVRVKDLKEAIFKLYSGEKIENVGKVI